VFGRLETAFRTAIERAQRSGELAGSGDPAAQALMLLAVVEGLQVVAKVETDRRRLETAVDAALASLH